MHRTPKCKHSILFSQALLGSAGKHVIQKQKASRISGKVEGMTNRDEKNFTTKLCQANRVKVAPRNIHSRLRTENRSERSSMDSNSQKENTNIPVDDLRHMLRQRKKESSNLEVPLSERLAKLAGMGGTIKDGNSNSNTSQGSSRESFKRKR